MRADLRDRVGAASGALAVQAVLLLALLLGLRVGQGGRPVADPPLLVEIPAVPPRVRPEPKRAGTLARGKSGPVGLRARPIVAAPPVIVLPTPIVAAPVADVGMAVQGGASDLPGAGSGAGGWGDGRGGGGDGDGGLPPRRIRGSLRNSDYPRAAAEAGAAGTVGVRYRVGVDGRAFQCLVTRSSGNDALDTATCALIERRFRFAPARDERGRPVTSTIVENHIWELELDEPERDRRQAGGLGCIGASCG